MPSDRWGTRAALVAGVLGLLAIAGGAVGHNPAETLFEPVPVGEDLIVLGAEGTYAYLTEDGEVQARGNVSIEGEVLARPVTADGLAATIVTSSPDVVPHVQAFDEEGPAWSVAIGEADTRAFLLPAEDGFAAFTTDARQVLVSTEGDVREKREIDVEPVTKPAPAPGEGWIVASREEVVHLVEGQIEARAEVQGVPTDVTVAGERVVVSLRDGGAGVARLRVLDASLETTVEQEVDALRFGGSPAIYDEVIVTATYGDAELVAFDADEGDIAWRQRLGEATAAAPARLGDKLVLATTEGVEARSLDGQMRAWSHETMPYIDSPRQVGQLVVAASADNHLEVFTPEGELAWSFTDGVEQVPWSHHGGPEGDGEDGATEDDGPLETPSVPVGGLLTLSALVARGRG